MADNAVPAGHRLEVERGERFTFGANWARFLELLDEERIASAEASLREMLEVQDLAGRRFIDVGSGSGLFSLAACRLGATVHSFDYDPQSVACTRELKRRYFPDDTRWRVDEASVLDPAYLASLGRFDIVYSWGVLHHTGAMWQALDNVVPLVADGGRLFIALYNDEGGASRRWTTVKRIYCRLPAALRGVFTVLVYAPIEIRYFLVHLVRFQLGEYFAGFRTYKRGRGMSRIRDMIDWIGGYPFEVSRPGEVFDFYRARGFTLARLKTGESCNEFVFDRSAGA
ncbi:MAG TPA: class I SAM-dependent methyltransferase [Burkholderiales bacterium]|nr:class I SAM-dependent methyltransferase [Burkholderiales bacterium]